MSRDLGRRPRRMGSSSHGCLGCPLPEKQAGSRLGSAQTPLFPVGQLSHITHGKIKGSPLSCHGTVAPDKGRVERNWLLRSEKSAPVVPGLPAFCPRRPSIVCQALASCRAPDATVPFPLESLAAPPTAQACSYLPQKVQVLTFPDLSAYLMKCLSAAPRPRELGTAQEDGTCPAGKDGGEGRWG